MYRAFRPMLNCLNKASVLSNQSLTFSMPVYGKKFVKIKTSKSSSSFIVSSSIFCFEILKISVPFSVFFLLSSSSSNRTICSIFLSSRLLSCSTIAFSSEVSAILPVLRTPGFNVYRP